VTTNDQPAAPFVVRLDSETIDLLADRLAERLSHQPDSEPQESGRKLSAAQVAARWGVERAWVYAHAEQLGALRLGTGPKPRLRFDAARVAEYLRSQAPADTSGSQPAARGRRADVRRSPRIHADCAEGLPFDPDPELSSVEQAQRPGGAATPPATAPEQWTSAR
jgi:hypothetical protein